MVKKLKSISEKKSSPAAGLLDGQLAQSVKDSAQQIWLAGMGAFAKAQEEGGKVFESLVKEGTSLQRKTQGLAEDKINEVTGKMSAMAGTVTAKAGQNWDKLEAIFEQRTAKAMSKLGVPTAKDIDSLSQRVEELAAAVAKMGKAGGSVRATAPAKKASKVPAKAASKSVAKPAAKNSANKAAVAKRTRKAAV
jgi:poly(hydroxyalkanoate) granule-associated protein